MSEIYRIEKHIHSYVFSDENDEHVIEALKRVSELMSMMNSIAPMPVTS